MKRNGIILDPNILKQQSEILGKRLKELEKKIYKDAEEEFNISSPKQLGYILYEKLKLGEKIKKNSGWSIIYKRFSAEKLKENNKIVRDVLEYRELSKLLSTYIDTLPNYIEKTEEYILLLYKQVVLQEDSLQSHQIFKIYQ